MSASPLPPPPPPPSEEIVPVTLCHRSRPAAPVPRSGWTCREAVCRRRGRRRRHGLVAASGGTVVFTSVTSLYAAAAASSSTDWRRLPTATGLTAHSCSPRNSLTHTLAFVVPFIKTVVYFVIYFISASSVSATITWRKQTQTGWQTQALKIIHNERRPKDNTSLHTDKHLSTIRLYIYVPDNKHSHTKDKWRHWRRLGEKDGVGGGGGSELDGSVKRVNQNMHTYYFSSNFLLFVVSCRTAACFHLGIFTNV